MSSPLSARELGSGPAVVLVHGGVGPGLTWERVEPLADRWTLVIPARRGFRPSPATDPEVAELARIGDAFLAGAGDPAEDEEFIRRAGIDPDAAGNRADEIAEALT